MPASHCAQSFSSQAARVAPVPRTQSPTVSRHSSAVPSQGTPSQMLEVTQCEVAFPGVSCSAQSAYGMATLPREGSSSVSRSCQLVGWQWEASVGSAGWERPRLEASLGSVRSLGASSLGGP